MYGNIKERETHKISFAKYATNWSYAAFKKLF